MSLRLLKALFLATQPAGPCIRKGQKGQAQYREHPTTERLRRHSSKFRLKGENKSAIALSNRYRRTKCLIANSLRYFRSRRVRLWDLFIFSQQSSAPTTLFQRSNQTWPQSRSLRLISNHRLNKKCRTQSLRQVLAAPRKFQLGIIRKKSRSSRSHLKIYC